MKYQTEPFEFQPSFIGNDKFTLSRPNQSIFTPLTETCIFTSVTLSIIIVTYNVRDLLHDCLKSVMAARENIDSEVFVVDNASSDHTVDLLAPQFPSVQFISNRENAGFAKANNQALARCSGTYVLFLNPDTALPADSLTRCIVFMDAHPRAGALGVRMHDASGRYLKESKRGAPTPRASFCKLTGLSGAFPRSKYFAGYYLGHLDDKKTHEVDVLSGAFFFARKEVLDTTGGFDERFFMYAEDIDLSYRIRAAGYVNYYFAEVDILHHKGGSTRKDAKYVIQFYRAMSQFVRKYYGTGAYATTLDAAIWLRGSVSMIGNIFRNKS